MSGGALEPMGPAAEIAAELWWFMLALSIPPFLLVVWLLVGAVRRRDRDEEAHQGAVAPWWLWAGGVALPLVLILLTFTYTVAGMRDVQWEPPPDAIAIEVEAYNFGWDVLHHANGEVLDGELRIPVGEPVAVRLTSRDVIHSFWVPQLAGKLDAMPGRITTMTLQAEEPGTYLGRCAEFCGLDHARMPVVVTALDEEDYAAWVEGP